MAGNVPGSAITDLQVLCLQDRVLSLFICPSGGSTTLRYGQVGNYPLLPCSHRTSLREVALGSPPKRRPTSSSMALDPQVCWSPTEACGGRALGLQSRKPGRAAFSSTREAPTHGRAVFFPRLSPLNTSTSAPWKPGSRGS